MSILNLTQCWSAYSTLSEDYYNLSAAYNASGCGTDACSDQAGKWDLGYHVGALFVILAASALGAAIPILAKYWTCCWVSSALALCLGKCVGTGVVLACGLVHMLQPAAESLTSPCVPAAFNSDYPAYAYLFAMVAGLFMQLVEFLLTQLLIARFTKTEQNPASTQPESEERCAAPGKDDSAEHIDALKILAHSHAHGVLAATEPLPKLIEAYMIEFGVTTHSVLIGLALGIVSDDELTTLLIALTFHQLFEGVALGCRVAEAGFSRVNALLMALVFSVSAPLGIAIGIATASSLNVNGETYLLVQGIFDAVCGGILIYIGYSLLLIDFVRDMETVCVRPHKRPKQAAMFAFLWLGAGLMAFIGKYV